MSKKDFIISSVVKVVAGLILVIATMVIIGAASSRSLPFMPENAQEYSIFHESSTTPTSQDESSVGDESQNQSSETSDPMTFEGYLRNIAVYSEENAAMPISTDRFVGQLLTRRSINDILGDMTNRTINVRMGFVFISNQQGVERILNARLEDVTARLTDCEFVGERDASGNPVFLKNGAYYFLDSNGDLQKSSYDWRIDPKGFDFDVPKYVGVQHEYIKKTRTNNLYGYRSSERIYVSNSNKESFAYSPEGVGIVIPNNNQNSLHFYNTTFTLLSSSYFASADRSLYSIGYYYFQNRITRVRVKNSNGSYTEALAYDNGTLIHGIPSDYTLRGFSDDCLLLERNGNYGYMSLAMQWLTTPTFIEAQPFLEGFAVVYTQKGKYGMLDTNGNMVVPAVFDELTSCSDGIFIGYERDQGYILFTKYDI